MAKASKPPVKPSKVIVKELAVTADQLPEIGNATSDQVFQEEKQELDAKKKESIRTIKLENDILEAQVDKLKRDNTWRSKMGNRISFIVGGWLVLVMAILFLVGANKIQLSDKVLITLLATTSVNVIGLLVIVSNYLFNKSKST